MTRKRWLIGGAVLAVVGLAGMYGWLKVQKGFSAREEPSAPEAFAARLMRSMSIPAGAKRLNSPKHINDAALAGARMHWADHCALCHANDGSGDTAIGRGLFPKPPNMRSPLTQSKSDGELFYIIENGIRLTGMPAWGDGSNGHSDESWALVGFIRTLPQLTAEDLQQMKAMNPKSAHEAMEEKDEDDFLSGDSPKPEHMP